METIVVPAEFGFLFMIPIAAFIYMIHQYYSLFFCIATYLFLQIGLAILARILYG